MNTAEISSISWPADQRIAEHRVLSGTPGASTVVMHRDPNSELGLWRVSPGEFTTIHSGYTEFISISSGRGQLIHDDGTVLELGPGTVAVLNDGWSGRWVIERTLIKSYAIVPTTP